MVSGSGLHGGTIDGEGWGILTATLKLYHHNLLQIGNMGLIHFIQCGVSVVIGSNHWVLQQSDQVNTIDPWPGKHEVVFVATSDRLPSH